MTITDALDLDGDKMVEEFMEGWLDTIRDRVKSDLPEDDDT